MSDPDTASTSEPTCFVSLFDPGGVMMTAHKIGEHLSERQAVALRAEVSAQGGMALIYQEPPGQIPSEADDASAKLNE